MDDAAYDKDVCCVCLECDGTDEEWTRFPDCRHGMHVRCLMMMCKYTSSCPVCRHVPHEMEPSFTQGEPSPVDISVEILTDEENDAAMEELRRHYRNFMNRRRRFVRARPHLLDRTKQIATIQREFRGVVKETQRLFERKSRLMWKNDPELAVLRQRMTRLRRRQLRLCKSLESQLPPAHQLPT